MLHFPSKFLHAQSLVSGLLATSMTFESTHRLNAGDAWIDDTVLLDAV
jgi:hypothetical protein